MLILSLDSTGPSCSACVWQDQHTLALTEELMDRGQDQRLLPIILDVMQKAGHGFDELDRVAITNGPGSFTGLRLGLATARGIGLAANKPVLGISRFDVFYQQVKMQKKSVLVVINSKRKELFCQFYPLDEPASNPFMIEAHQIPQFLADKGPVIVTGDFRIESSHLFQAPTEKEVMTSAALASHADPSDPAFLPRPLYIRAPDVTLKMKTSFDSTLLQTQSA